MIVPDICNVLPEIIRDDPASIVKLLTEPVDPVLNTGLLDTFGIWTESVWVGIKPQLQLPVAFQSVLAAPVQLNVAEIVMGLSAVTPGQPPAAAIVFVTI